MEHPQPRAAPPPPLHPPYQPAPAHFPPQQAPPQAGYHQYGTVPPQPGNQYGLQMVPKPDNYIGLSLGVILCYCWIFGLIALYYGFQVNTAYENHDYEGANRYSKLAKYWNCAAMLTGYAIGLFVVIVSAASSAA